MALGPRDDEFERTAILAAAAYSLLQGDDTIDVVCRVNLVGSDAETRAADLARFVSDATRNQSVGAFEIRWED